jgi:hypothetical protein
VNPCPLSVSGYRRVNGYGFEKGRSPFFRKKPVVPAARVPTSCTRVPAAPYPPLVYYSDFMTLQNKKYICKTKITKKNRNNKKKTEYPCPVPVYPRRARVGYGFLKNCLPVPALSVYPPCPYLPYPPSAVVVPGPYPRYPLANA